MLNAAVIGVGSMGKNHARVYSDLSNVNLVAVADNSKENAIRVSRKYGCKYYTDYKKMLENENIDLVSIAVPTKMHKMVAFDVIEKEINVLIEKPIASTVMEGKEIIKLAEKNKVKIMIGHIERFNPAIIELKKRIDAGELGRIFKIDVNRIGPFPSRIRDVGVVIDLAVHDLDIMRYLTSSEVSRMYAETESKINTDYEDLLSALIKFNNGVICSLNINWLTPAKIRKLYITGEKGMFVANYLTQNLYFYENDEINNHFEYADIMRGVSEGRMIKFNIKKKEPLLAEIEHFVDCVENDKEPLIKGEDGLIALELAQRLINPGRS